MDIPETKAARSPPSQAPDEQPDAKKIKVSIPAAAENVETAAVAVSDADTAATKPKYRCRKTAIFFAYCGVGYQGMQKNPGAKTIEGELEEALFRAGAVPESERGNPRSYDWARSARTDKGVSAVGQVVSGRFFVDPPGLVDRLNSNLPNQIRIFGYKRVTPSFSAKKFCDRRRYVYLIPVFALDPCQHRYTEAAMASLGSGRKSVTIRSGTLSNGADGVVNTEIKEINEGVKITSESEVMVNTSEANQVSDSKIVEKEEELDCPEVKDDGSMKINLKSDAIVNLDEANANLDLKMVETEEKSNLSEVLQNEAPDSSLKCCKEQNALVENGESVNVSNFHYGEEEKERFNRILKHYVGSHNFHNFTTRTKAEDPSANRYIVSFTANATVNVDGIEFVKCEVVGQSFMLHQIRKMIGLAVAVMRDLASESIFETVFKRDVNKIVPMAPEVGLYLDECIFTSYNKKWKKTHEELSMKQFQDEAEAFKLKHIFPHIALAEHKEGVVAHWLYALNPINYPDLAASGEVKISETDGEKGNPRNCPDFVSAKGSEISEKNGEEGIPENCPDFTAARESESKKNGEEVP